MGFFKLDFEKKEILIFGKITEFEFRNSEMTLNEKDDYEYSILFYDFKGIPKKQYLRIIKDLKFLESIKPNKILIYKESYKNDLIIYDFENDLIKDFDLLNNKLFITNRKFNSYEYLDCVQNINDELFI